MTTTTNYRHNIEKRDDVLPVGTMVTVVNPNALKWSQGVVEVVGYARNDCYVVRSAEGCTHHVYASWTRTDVLVPMGERIPA